MQKRLKNGKYESSREFLDRSYVNWVKDKVLVFPEKAGVGKCVIWNVEQARQYLSYLKSKSMRLQHEHGLES